MSAQERLPILEGRRFGCTQCGNCCVQPGYVYMTREELSNIAAHLGLTPERFRRKFCVRLDGASGEPYIHVASARGCPLLTPERRCSVHPVKPKQCTTFPFWDEMVEDRTEWEGAKAFCPGLDAPEGRLYTHPEITAIRRGHRGT